MAKADTKTAAHGVVLAYKPADKRPVWVIRPDGTDAHVIECLRFQCAIDGSRASWKP